MVRTAEAGHGSETGARAGHGSEAAVRAGRGAEIAVRAGHGAEAASPADEVWTLLRMLFGRQRRRFLIAAAELDLHPAQAGALLNLDPAGPLPMNELASLLACDSSNITGITDRLEARGLVLRRPYAQDRRVKHVVLTAKGRRLRERLLDRIGTPVAFERLSEPDQRQLRDLLRRLIDG